MYQSVNFSAHSRACISVLKPLRGKFGLYLKVRNYGENVNAF